MSKNNDGNKTHITIDGIIKSPQLLNDDSIIELINKNIISKTDLLRAAVSKDNSLIVKTLVDKVLVFPEQVVEEASSHHNYSMAEQFISQTAIIKDSHTLLTIAKDKRITDILVKKNKTISAIAYKEAMNSALDKETPEVIEELAKLEKNSVVLGVMGEKEYEEQFINYELYQEKLKEVIQQNEANRDQILINFIKAGTPINFNIVNDHKTQTFVQYVFENCSLPVVDSIIDAKELNLVTRPDINLNKVNKLEKVLGEKKGIRKQILDNLIQNVSKNLENNHLSKQTKEDTTPKQDFKLMRENYDKSRIKPILDIIKQNDLSKIQKLLTDKTTQDLLKNNIPGKKLVLEKLVSQNNLLAIDILIKEAVIIPEQVIEACATRHKSVIAEKYISNVSIIKNSATLLGVAEDKDIINELIKKNKPISAIAYKEAIENCLSNAKLDALKQLTKLEKYCIVLGAVSEQEYKQQFIDYEKYQENIQKAVSQSHPDKDNIIISYIKAGVPTDFNIQNSKKTQPFFLYALENCNAKVMEALTESSKLEIPKIDTIDWHKIGKLEKAAGEKPGTKKALFDKYILENGEINQTSRKDLLDYKIKLMDHAFYKLISLFSTSNFNDELFTKKIVEQVGKFGKISESQVSEVVSRFKENIKQFHAVKEGKNSQNKSFFEKISYKIEDFCKSIAELFTGSTKNMIMDITAQDIRQILLAKEAKQIVNESKLSMHNENKHNQPIKSNTTRHGHHDNSRG